MSQDRDPEVIAQMQAGSLEALGILYDRYNPMVYRTALAITGDQDAANDLLQDVFLRLFRFADRIDLERPLEPWLYRMTANLSYTWIKRNNRWVRSFEELGEWLAGTSRNTLHETVERRDDWDQVQRAVTKLPFSQRVVIVLYYLNDLSIDEIAEILEVPVGTVKSRLHYGRLALKKILGLGRVVDAERLPDWEFKSP